MADNPHLPPVDQGVPARPPRPDAAHSAGYSAGSEPGEARGPISWLGCASLRGLNF